MAAALRLLLRRRASAPSLALLQPLFPGRYPMPLSPLLATAATAAVGLPDVHRPQLSPAPASPLLRYYSSKPPNNKGCEPPPQRQPPTSGKETPRLELKLEPEDVEFLTGGVLEDFEKHTRNLVEALKICKKANALLNEGWDNKTAAMFENGLVKAFEALANCEKALNDLSGALSSSNALSKDSLQRLQMFHEKWIDDNKFSRKQLTDVLAYFVSMKIRNKIDEVDLQISLLGGKKPDELSKFKGTAVALGMCFAFAMMINVIFSHIIRI